jgi:hypothetical protein
LTADGDKGASQDTPPPPAVPNLIAERMIQVRLSPLGAIDFIGCYGVHEEEWERVKQAYRKCVLKYHPDKGGNPSEFRKVFAYSNSAHQSTSPP